MPDVEVAALLESVLAADERAIARALALVEDTRREALPAQRALLATLASRTPPGHTVVGITGPPGAGKSTLAAALIRRWTASGASVGVVAVDPSSRRSGGALLGDRVRLALRPGEGIFVRSMAARDRLGGLAPATRAAVLVMHAAFPFTLVETVGVGQSEVDVETVADVIVLCLQPGAGDTLQFMKAGILEIPDVLVVHKWDLGAPAARTRSDLESILGLSPPPAGTWKPPVLGVSSHTGEGVGDLARVIAEYREQAERSGSLRARRERARATWALELFLERYGSLGLERVGGRPAAEQLIRETPGTGLDAFSVLATRAGLEPALPRAGASGGASGSR